MMQLNKCFSLIIMLLLVLLVSGCAKEPHIIHMDTIEVVDSLPQNLSLEEIEQNSGDDFYVRYEPQTNRIKEINGNYSPVMIQNCKDAVLSLGSVRDIMGIQSLEFSLIEEDHSREGLQVFTIQQLYKGLAVSSAIMQVIATTEGRAICVRGTYVKDITVDTQPMISENKARKALSIRLGEDIHSVQLSVYVTLQHEPCLSWKYRVLSTDILKSRDVYISAIDGRYLAESPLAIN